ncbi:MAG: nucleotidyl transferase AbiEii/AbiGii toxin family protein [Bacteroidota bacterium]
MPKDFTSKVLSVPQREFFGRLGFTRAMGLYLAGGTALALQIGHRRSVDFDFYSQKHFTKGEIAERFQRGLGKGKRKIIRDIDDTFEVNARPGIRVSCFYYRYPLLKKPGVVNGVLVASLEDIAAMKIVAISQRGARRDFVDIFYLLRLFSLKKIFDFTRKKYPKFDIHHGLRGLLYFKDADEDVAAERALVFDRNLAWSTIKGDIVKAVTKRFPQSLS